MFQVPAIDVPSAAANIEDAQPQQAKDILAAHRKDSGHTGDIPYGCQLEHLTIVVPIVERHGDDSLELGRQLRALHMSMVGEL